MKKRRIELLLSFFFFEVVIIGGKREKKRENPVLKKKEEQGGKIGSLFFCVHMEPPFGCALLYFIESLGSSKKKGKKYSRQNENKNEIKLSNQKKV